jgi:circadian clock protein KaiC
MAEEVDGRLMHVVSCLKKRLGDFEPDIREFRITRAGLQVGHRLEGLRGVLTGVPERR